MKLKELIEQLQDISDEIGEDANVRTVSDDYYCDLHKIRFASARQFQSGDYYCAIVITG